MSIEKKLKNWLKKQGYTMGSAKDYATSEGIAERTAYQRIENDKVEYIQIDGTKILLIKDK